jgi:tetratricopeptide (TPR) repeat protein
MDRVRQRAAGFAALGILLGSMACATSGSDQASERDLARARAHFEMGIDYLGTGQNALALRELMAAEQYDPKNARIHHALAEAYRRKGKLAESEKHLKIVLELHPPFHDARLMLSSLYIAEERYDEAIAQASHLPRPLAGAHQPGLGVLPARTAHRGTPRSGVGARIQPHLLDRAPEPRHP